MTTRLAPAALTLATVAAVIAGCVNTSATDSSGGSIGRFVGFAGGVSVFEIHLSDGTRCIAVDRSGGGAGITCDWR